MSEKKFSIFIGYWRGIAALSILTLHFFSEYSYLNSLWVATDTFFILSGYLLMQNHVSTTFVTIHYKIKFIRRKMLKLLPLVTIALFCRLILIITELIKENLTASFGLKPVNLWTQISYLVFSFLCIQFLYPTSIQIFVPLWFVTVYFWILILVVALSITHSLKRIVGFTFFGLLLFQFSINLSSDSAEFEDQRKWIYLFARGILGLGMGMIVSWVLDCQYRNHFLMIFQLILVVCLVFAKLWDAPERYFVIKTDTFFCLILSFFLLYEKIATCKPGRFEKLAFYFSKYSFGVYLFHPILLVLVPKHIMFSNYRGFFFYFLLWPRLAQVLFSPIFRAFYMIDSYFLWVT